MHATTQLIKQNAALRGAREFIVKTADGDEVGKMPLGSKAPPSGDPECRIIVASDIHIGLADTSDVFAELLAYADADPLCKAVIVCGDLVNNGLVEDQRTDYYNLIHAASTPVYSIAGNHDTIWGYPTDEHMVSYTDYPHYYAVAKTDNSANRIYANDGLPDNTLLICLGHYGKDHSGNANGDWRGGEQFSAAELAWFEAIMAENTDKRRIVCMHPYIPDGAGDPPLASDSPKGEPPNLWTKNPAVSTDAGAEFLAILARYPGAMVFNGHSHYRFRTQEEQSHAVIYEPADGSYIGIHVPSATKLRDVQNGWRIDIDKSSADYGGEGYVLDLYTGTYLRGRDFVKDRWVGIGTYML